MATVETVKPMVIEAEGKTYTLEFNRNSVVSAERHGLNLSMIQEAPMTMIPLLFFAAFKKHHPNINREQTDHILFDVLGGLTADEVKRLGDLYNAPTATLFHDGGERKNVTVSL